MVVFLVHFRSSPQRKISSGPHVHSMPYRCAPYGCRERESIAVIWSYLPTHDRRKRYSGGQLALELQHVLLYTMYDCVIFIAVLPFWRETVIALDMSHTCLQIHSHAVSQELVVMCCENKLESQRWCRHSI